MDKNEESTRVGLKGHYFLASVTLMRSESDLAIAGEVNKVSNGVIRDFVGAPLLRLDELLSFEEILAESLGFELEVLHCWCNRL